MKYNTISSLRDIVEEKRLDFEELYKNTLSDYHNNALLLIRAIDLIVVTSKKMACYEASQDAIDQNLYAEINSLSESELKKIADEVYTEGAISIIRYVIVQMFIKKEISSAENLKDKIKELKNDFIQKNIDKIIPYLEKEEIRRNTTNFIKNYNKGNPFRAWGPDYRYLLPCIYNIQLRDSIWSALEVVRDALLYSLQIQDTWESRNSQGWYNKVRSYFGFEGPSNYGSQRAAIMLHPKAIPDHKNAIQLICYFYEGKIWAGCDIGTNVNDKKLKSELGNWNRIECFDYSKISGTSSDYDQIKQNFSQIVQVLKNNLDYAQKYNNKHLKENPEIGTSEIAEGNAEKSNDGDLNLFDPYDSEQNTEHSGQVNLKPPIINKAQNISEKKIYPDISIYEDCLERTKIADYFAKQIIMNKNIKGYLQ